MIYLKRLFIPFLIAFLPLIALASNVSVTQDVTIILPSDSSQYVLKASSSFDSASVAVTPSSFSFVVNPGDTVTITSTDDKNLTNSINAVTTCGSPSSVSLSVPTAETVTVTPTATCTTPSSANTSSGGGGGGMIVGSGPLAPSAAGVEGYENPVIQINSPDRKVAYLDATTTASSSTTPATPGASHVSITHNHHLGDHSNDILALQQFLNTHGFTVATTALALPDTRRRPSAPKHFKP
jgi:hypothetical protein